MTNYTGNVDWGDWQQMPDYRSGWKDKNKSSIGSLITYLDPHTSLGKMPFLKNIDFLEKGSNFHQEGNDRLWTGANRVLEPVMKVLSKGGKYTDPVQGSLSMTFPEQHQGITDWATTHGADVAAIVAATYFSGGAAAGALGAGAGAGAGAATSGLGAAGSAAITPALASLGAAAAPAAASGTAGLAAAGSAAITPALASLAGSAASTGMLSGGLGLAGTAAANSMLTPSLASLGTAAAEPGLLSTVKDIYGYASKGKDYYSNLNNFAKNNGPTDQQRYNQQAGAMADRILNANKPQTARQKVSNQLMINKFGMR